MCPVCDGSESIIMGILGNRVHYECRDCGMQYSETATPEYLDMLQTDFNVEGG